MTKQKQKHNPVLLSEVLSSLQPKGGETYLDLTAGYGGHAKAILRLTENADAVLADRDDSAIEELRRSFPSAEILHCDFLSALEKLKAERRSFDLILADLGVSSPHLDNSDRGFSF